MSQTPLKIKISDCFCEQKQKDSCPLPPCHSFATTGSPWGLASKPTTRNSPQPRRGGGKSLRSAQSPQPWTAWGGGRELWNPTVFYTRKLYSAFLCFVPMPFRDPRCVPALHSTGKTAAHEQCKEASWWAEHQLSSLMFERHKTRWHHFQKAFFPLISKHLH